FDQPFRQFMVMPEMSIPLATATALGCFFGALLVTGYNFEGQAKAFGTALAVISAAGLFAFAVLIPQTGRPFRSSGALLAVVVLMANLVRAVAFAAIRRQDRPVRGKKY